MNQKLRNLVYTAMLMALCCVATLVIKIPTVTGGYLNAGDIVVVLAALLAGPLYGGVAAGFGSGLADVISGYMSYAPGTLVVKGCAAVVAALIFRACRKKNFGFALLSAICGEIIMVLGYFVFEDFILGYGLAAAGEIPGNACQAAVGVAGRSGAILCTEQGSSAARIRRIRVGKERKISFQAQNSRSRSGAAVLHIPLHHAHTDDLRNTVDPCDLVIIKAAVEIHHGIGVRAVGLLIMFSTFRPVLQAISRNWLSIVGTFWCRMHTRLTPMRSSVASGKLTEFLMLPLAR